MDNKLLDLLDSCTVGKIHNKKTLYDLGFSDLNDKDFKELQKMSNQIIKQYTQIINKMKNVKNENIYYVDGVRKIKITEQMLNELIMSMLATIEDAKTSAYCVKGYKPKKVRGYKKGGFNKPVFVSDKLKLFFYDNLSNFHPINQTIGEYEIEVPSPLHSIHVNKLDEFKKYCDENKNSDGKVHIVYSELYNKGVIDLLFKDFFKYNISCVGILYNLFLLYTRTNNLSTKVNNKRYNS